MRSSPESAAASAPTTVPRPGRRRGSIAQLAAASYVTLVLGFVTGPIIARVLGPVARGEYAAVYVYATALITVLAFGFPQAITHRLVNRLESPERLIGAALRFSALLCLPAVGIGALVVDQSLETLSGTARTVAIVAIAFAPLGVLGSSLQAFLTTSGALGALTWLRVTPLVVNFAGVVALALLDRLTLVSYLILTVGITLLSFALVWYFVALRPRGHARLRPLLGFGLRGYPGSFARMLNVQVDQILLIPLIGPAQLAFYAIGVTISRVPVVMAEAIGVRTTGSVIGPQRRLLTDRAERYMRLALLVSLGGGVVIGAASPLVVPLLYGTAFEGVVGPLLFLLPGTIANAGSRVAVACLVVTGRPGVTSSAEVVGLAVTAIGLWYALPRFGIAGAAAVSSVAYGSRFVIQLAVLRGLGVRSIVPRLADARDVLNVMVRPLLRARGPR